MELGKDSLERIIENLHDGLYFVDRDRVRTYWNKAAEQIFDFCRPEEAAVQRLRGLFS